MTTELQWRRSWKPDLRACPWQPMEVDGNTYLAKFRFMDDSYELMFTDLTMVWMEHLEAGALRKRIQKLNPSLEAQVTKILDHIQSNLESPTRDTELSVGFTAGDDSGDSDTEKMRLTVKSKLAGMPFLWRFNGEPVENKKVSEHLTFPLLTMVAELFRRQQEMVKIIASKDKEIADYKSQGVKTSRKHYETAPFDGTAFRHNMVTSPNFETEVTSLGMRAFSEGGQDLYRDIMTKHAWLKRSPSTAGEGTDSLSDETSLDQPLPSSGGTSWGNRLPPSLAPTSPRVSPQKSPKKSPPKSPGSSSTPDSSPTKDTEILRRKALEKRLLEEEAKKESKAKKKKKIAF